MSRLYGKSIDVYSASKDLVDINNFKYKRDNKKTTWEEVESCPEVLDLYLPENAIEIIENNPIKIVASPVVVKQACLLPSKEGEEPTIYFPRWSPIEEYKRELVFFLGEFLAIQSRDEMPKENDLPCEFSNVIGLFLEYLYLKENGKDKLFANKHLEELTYNARNYIKAYKNYQKALVSRKQTELYLLSDEQQERVELGNKQIERQFLNATLTTLIPLSSLDATLQLIDKNLSKNDIKELLRRLVENEDHDRQIIINEIGIDTFGYKRLRKEIGR